jgi:hypothetical protein
MKWGITVSVTPAEHNSEKLNNVSPVVVLYFGTITGKSPLISLNLYALNIHIALYSITYGLWIHGIESVYSVTPTEQNSEEFTRISVVALTLSMGNHL